VWITKRSRRRNTPSLACATAQYPSEAIFAHDAMEIHPFSYAGRFLDDAGGPLRRVWSRFMCHHDGWMYEQPYFALNPDKFEGSSNGE
jgi:hypothetical protein